MSNTNTAGQVMTGAQEKNKAGDGDRAERRLEEGEGGSRGLHPRHRGQEVQRFRGRTFLRNRTRQM